MDAKLTKLTQHMAKEEWEKALKMAAKFHELGDQKEAIMQAHQAITNERFYRQIGKDPDKAIEAGIEALKERYPDYLDYGDVIKGKAAKRKEVIKKKEAKRKAVIASGDEVKIAELEHGILSWERILIRSGFVFKKNNDSFDFTPEQKQNITFLKKILTEIGEGSGLDGHIFTPSVAIVDQSTWLSAVNKLHSDAEGGSCNNLAIMDTYLAGMVRWVNSIGIKTDISCDGHGRRNPSLTLNDKNDAVILDACLVLLSDSAWRFESPCLKYPQQPGRGLSKKRNVFHRGWLLNVAEHIQSKQKQLAVLVEQMREVLQDD
ncbi:MAG: hypothetical protein ACI8PB_004384 [Desulforhopalus sp.]|jgi:hypothetical protein